MSNHGTCDLKVISLRKSTMYTNNDLQTQQTYPGPKVMLLTSMLRRALFHNKTRKAMKQLMSALEKRKTYTTLFAGSYPSSTKSDNTNMTSTSP